MRLNINLATQPYQDVKRYLTRWGTLLLLFVVASAWFSWHTLASWRQTRDVNAGIERVKREIKSLDDERARAEALLAKPENKTVADQSKLLNELFARKAFSWTAVFMQLEEIMPAQLHVLQLSPELNKQNQLVLRLLVAGGSRDHALELLQRLEKSPYFTNAQLRSETLAQGAAPGDTVQFDISALYIPHPELAPKAAKPDEPKKAMEEKPAAKPIPVISAAKTPDRKAGH